jgi:transposase
MAFELGKGKWKLAFSDGNKVRYVTIPARDLIQLSAEIAKAKAPFGLADDTGILSCYEAGRDGFWLHRCLLT